MKQTNSQLSVRPVTSAVGAEIRGIELASINDDDFVQVRAAWRKYSALVFRNQQLSDADLIRFSERFGDLDPPPVNESGKTFVPDHPEIYVVSNVIGSDGMPIGSLGAGEAVWHTDMSYLPEPPDASLLYSLEIPPDGGATSVISMESALAALPRSLLSRIKHLRIKHDGTYNSAGYLRKGFTECSDPRSSPGAIHPIVCVHPETGRPNLYLGRRRNAYIVGLSLEDSEALLDEIWDTAITSEHAYTHRWVVGDLLMWDNRTTMHCRDPFDPKSRRVMHRTQIKGSAQPRAYYPPGST
jgi:taurine dioxygenase